MPKVRPRRLRHSWAACVLAAVCAVGLSAGTVRAQSEEYVVGEGDVLHVTVFGHPDLTTTAPVGRGGELRFPLVGQVAAAGRTVAQIAGDLTEALADGYLVEPQVTVAVREYRTKKSSILGKVNRPGQYEFRGRMSFLELISRAGGLSPEAGDQALVRRPSGSGQVVAGDLVVDVKALIEKGDLFRDIEIADGDTVTVPEAGVLHLTGEVRRPGDYRHEEGMTVLRAITLAGGFSEKAAPERVTLIRSEGGRERVVEVGAAGAGLDQPVRPDDIVVVGAVRTEVCYVTGEVKHAGAFRCEKDTNVLKAVTLAGGFTDSAARSKIRIVRRVDGREQVHERVGLEDPVLPDDVLVVPKSFF